MISITETANAFPDIHWIFHETFCIFSKNLRILFLVANDKLTFQDTYILFIQSLLKKTSDVLF